MDSLKINVSETVRMGKPKAKPVEYFYYDSITDSHVFPESELQVTNQANAPDFNRFDFGYEWAT